MHLYEWKKLLQVFYVKRKRMELEKNPDRILYLYALAYGNVERDRDSGIGKNLLHFFAIPTHTNTPIYYYAYTFCVCRYERRLLPYFQTSFFSPTSQRKKVCGGYYSISLIYHQSSITPSQSLFLSTIEHPNHFSPPHYFLCFDFIVKFSIFF